jgi:hypothetical protein
MNLFFPNSKSPDFLLVTLLILLYIHSINILTTWFLDQSFIVCLVSCYFFFGQNNLAKYLEFPFKSLKSKENEPALILLALQMFICKYHKKALLILNHLKFLNILHLATLLLDLVLILYFAYYFFQFSTFRTIDLHFSSNHWLNIEINYYSFKYGWNLFSFEIIILNLFN